MLDANNLLELIKRAAKEAVNAAQDSDFCYGTVITANPLKILVEQKMELTAAQLVLCRNVTNHTVTVTAGNTKDYYYTEDNEDDENDGTAPIPTTSHVHAIGTVQMTVHNALKTGDKVVLIRKKGGQEYLVLDRVVKA